jgi:hypothetical protein
MIHIRMPAALIAVAFAGLATACGGGGSGGGGGGYGGGGTTPTPTNPPLSTQQVVRLALPTTAIGAVNDPTYGLIGGYTQAQYSQVLGFATGSQIMIQNDQASLQHTLGDTGGTSSFPANPNLSTTATTSSTFSGGFQSGTLNPGQIVGPFTLAAGVYYIGCAFHYQTNNMRDVLVVSANAAPGPQATAQAGIPTPNPTDPSYKY